MDSGQEPFYEEPPEDPTTSPGQRKAGFSTSPGRGPGSGTVRGCR